MHRGMLQRWLPSEEKLRSQRGLRWLGPLLRRPWLWHLNRRRVAMGAAIGAFRGSRIAVILIAAAGMSLRRKGVSRMTQACAQPPRPP